MAKAKRAEGPVCPKCGKRSGPLHRISTWPRDREAVCFYCAMAQWAADVDASR
jgi:hypothetical protein